MDNTRVYRMAFASVYPHVAKAEKKGRTKEELHAVIHWLTGYDEKALQQVIARKIDFETFFAQAPRINPNVAKITGVITKAPVDAALEAWAVEAIQSKHVWERAEAAAALRHFPSDAKITRLKELLGDPGLHPDANGQVYLVRRRAYEALSRIGVRVPEPAARP